MILLRFVSYAVNQNKDCSRKYFLFNLLKRENNPADPESFQTCLPLPFSFFRNSVKIRTEK